jgi:hypothetical protein
MPWRNGEGAEVYIYSFFNFVARRRWVDNAAPRPLYPCETDTIRMAPEAGWASRPVRAGAENLSSTGIRSSDRRARSESLYRLSYRGPLPQTAQTYLHLLVCEFATRWVGAILAGTWRRRVKILARVAHIWNLTILTSQTHWFFIPRNTMW